MASCLCPALFLLRLLGPDSVTASQLCAAVIGGCHKEDDEPLPADEINTTAELLRLNRRCLPFEVFDQKLAHGSQQICINPIR